MSSSDPGGARRAWHRRLDVHVAIAVAGIVAAAVGAVLYITGQAVSTESRGRAAAELEAARDAFYRLMEDRAATAVALATLVTELPVFRAHLTDARLASDKATLAAMADEYRQQLAADFAVVSDARGRWLASPGWHDHENEGLQRVIEAARLGGTGRDVIRQGNGLILVVSVPARFADEILGTFTLGYPLTDAFANELAQLARCEVVFTAGDEVAATSLAARRDPDLAGLARQAAAASAGVLSTLLRVGGSEYVGGLYPVSREADQFEGRLLLLADWRPTQATVDRLRGRVAAGGLVVFGFALAGGLVFSRHVSRPLRDIAGAAAKIAGGDFGLELPVRGSAEAVTVARAFNDMNASLRAARDRLIHDAIHDPLTQLPNRVLFMERLERAMARRVRHPSYRFAVLFIDLDRFKHVNDSLGHTAGDQLLVAFAERLGGAVRRNDIVTRLAAEANPEPNTLARFGGDEFVILLDDIREPVDAVRVAERVQSLSGQPLAISGHDVFVSPSIGVAVCSPDHRTGDEVVRDADLAMFRAKNAGGACYAVFDAAMHLAAVERLKLETELRRAVERHEFCLWYQPIVSLADRRVVGVEALIRWRHPERGILYPAAFLAVAEEIGVIAHIDEWALAEACRQGETWRRARPGADPITMSVNLSSKAFGSPTLVPRVAAVLSSTGFPAGALRLEVTETVAIADPDRVRSVLTELRSLGVRVSLDDFGTGYCSLSYLQQFPVDTLKIDRSFISRIGGGGEQGEIIRLIVSLARTLGLEVVAEGTETEEQVAYLGSLGCGYGQGFLFARPVAPDELSF
jgi:EAL domain-containing protein (putative c-di-GMP-specific phosphodiesterase class I)/GGDEF domain-containing protein